MISNIQHQNFDGVIIDKIYSNNTNTNNIQIMATTNQNLNGFTTISPTKMKKSYLEIDQNNIHNNITNYNNININNNAKEIVNVTSQQNNLNYNQNQNENMKMENSIIINNNNNNNNICHNQNAFQQSLKQNIINNTKINNNNNNLFKSDNNNKHINNNNNNNNNVIIIHNKKELIKTSPIKMIERNENQEHAFRCIEDVHNYSKLKRYNSNDYSTKHDYSSSEVEEEDQDDDDDDYEEDNEYEYDEQQDINNKKQKTEYIIINNNNNNNKNVNKNRNYEISNEKKIKNNIDHVPENDDDEKQTPEHHARRPMNAFLIFCKRHRAIVREKYKHLENRSITKILGDWWATLDIDEKTCYTNLAKQYKDAFFSANPNFKWYKLPAPPLRTLTTRPTNTERPLMISNLNYSYTNDYDTIINNKDLNYRNKQQQEQQQQSEQNDSEEIHQQQQQQQQESIISSTIINNNSIITKKSSSISSSSKNDVGVFKLADEAQMGDLSNLIMHNHSPANENKICSNGNLSSSENENDNNLLDCIKTPPILDLNQKALQSALSETSNFIQNKINQRNDQQLLEPFENMRDHANKMVMNDQQNMITINGKRKSTTPIDEHYFKECKKQLLLQNNHKQDVVHQQQQQQHQEKRSSRSCKGKKYQEFINSGQITTIVKKSKIKTPSSCQTTTSQTFPHNGYCKMINNDIFINKQLKTDNNSTLIRLQQQQQSNNDNLKNIQSLESPTKQFDASDFDLEEKIKALPAQDLDDYLSRKRETKKKKKIKSKRHSTTTVTTTTPTTTAKTAVNKTNNNKQQQHQQQLFMLRQQEVKERLQNAAMVGSQKRKARKESITRRDINSINNDDDNTNLLETVESLVQLGATIKTEEDDGLLQFGATTTIIKTDDDDDDDDLFTNVHPIQLSANKTTSDLLILAQVASNHIDDEILPD